MAFAKKYGKGFKGIIPSRKSGSICVCLSIVFVFEKSKYAMQFARVCNDLQEKNGWEVQPPLIAHATDKKPTGAIRNGLNTSPLSSLAAWCVSKDDSLDSSDESKTTTTEDTSGEEQGQKRRKKSTKNKKGRVTVNTNDQCVDNAHDCEEITSGEDKNEKKEEGEHPWHPSDGSVPDMEANSSTDKKETRRGKKKTPSKVTKASDDSAEYINLVVKGVNRTMDRNEKTNHQRMETFEKKLMDNTKQIKQVATKLDSHIKKLPQQLDTKFDKMLRALKENSIQSAGDTGRVDEAGNETNTRPRAPKPPPKTMKGGVPQGQSQPPSSSKERGPARRTRSQAPPESEDGKVDKVGPAR